MSNNVVKIIQKEIGTNVKKEDTIINWKRLIGIVALVMIIFSIGYFAGVYSSFNGAYKIGQKDILTKYYCTERMGYNINQCTLPECQKVEKGLI